jgi:uncharacterized protein (TIGR02594 family)
MAKLKKPDEFNIQGSANISEGLTASLAQGSASIGSALSQAARSNTTNVGSVMRELGQSISAQGSRQLAVLQESIDNSLVTKKVNDGTLALNQAVHDRLSNRVDADGNPTFGSLSEDIRSIGENILNDTTSGILNPNVKNRIQQQLGSQVLSSQIRSLSQARQQQQDFSNAAFLEFQDTTLNNAKADDMSMFDEHVQTYRAALDGRLQAGEITATQHQKSLQAFESEVSLSHINQLIQTEPERALELLNQNAANLDVDTNMIAKSKARQSIKAKESLIAAQDSALLKQTETIFKEAEGLLDKGIDIPADTLNQLIKFAKESGSEKLIGKVNSLLVQEELVSSFSKLSESKRSGILDQMNSQFYGNDALNDGRDRLNNLHKYLNEQLEEDPVALASQQKLFPEKQTFDTNGDIVAQLEDRADARALIKARYGVVTSGLTKSESKDLGRKLNTLDTTEKLEAIGQISKVLGRDAAVAFFATIGDEGNSLLALSGIYEVEGQTSVAENILDGQKILKDKTFKLPQELNSAVLAELPQYANIRQKQDVLSAAKAIYAKKAFDAGNIEEIDSDLLKESIEEATNGGIIEFNDENIEPPVFGMSEDEFEGFIETLTEEDVPLLSGDVEQIKDGILVNEGRGVYSVRPTGLDDQAFSTDDEGEVFILDYNEIINRRNGNESVIDTPSDPAFDALESDASEEQINTILKARDVQLINKVDQGSKHIARDPITDVNIRNNSGLQDVISQKPKSHLDIAMKLTGLNENRDTKTLAAFFKKSLGKNINPKHTPWCAAFVNGVLQSAGHQGSGSLAARSFLKWGQPVDKPSKGDIAVFSRGSNTAKGHVGFYMGETSEGIQVLGGNQSDSVTTTTYAKGRLLGFRKPPKSAEIRKMLQ